MQEVVLVANMVAPGQLRRRPGARGSRRGANIGRTREIWPTLDGFVSFGLRGGKARVPSLEILTKLVAGDGVAPTRSWTATGTTFNQNTATDEELAAIEAAVAEYFARHTMQELYDIACETNLMLAPANSPREIYAVGAARGARLLRAGRRRRRASRSRSSSRAPPATRSRRCSPAERRARRRARARSPRRAGARRAAHPAGARGKA